MTAAKTARVDDRWVWLLAGPLPDEPPTTSAIEAGAAVIRRAKQILPHTASRLCAWAGASYGDHPTILRLSDEAVVHRAAARVRARYAQRALESLDAVGIEAVLLKGSATRLAAYEDPWTRVGEDIDVGVAPGEAIEAETALLELGFEPAEWWTSEIEFRRANVFRRLLEEADHHEMGMIVRWTLVPDLEPSTVAAINRLQRKYPWRMLEGGRPSCYIIIDIHYGLSNSLAVEPLVRSRRWVTRQGIGGWIPTLGWSLLHATVKLYWEAHQTYCFGMHLLLDLVELLRVADADDVREFLALVGQYGIQVPAYYVLRRAAALAEKSDAPPIGDYLEQWGAVEPSHDPVALMDMGDFWPKLWGFR